MFLDQENIPENMDTNIHEFKLLLLRKLIKLADQNGFNSLERPKQVMIMREPFTVENGMLTPTMKFKRAVAKQHYLKEIDSLYKLKPITKKELRDLSDDAKL